MDDVRTPSQTPQPGDGGGVAEQMIGKLLATGIPRDSLAIATLLGAYADDVLRNSIEATLALDEG